MSLKVVNLCKRYKDRWVLRDISFEILDSEVFGIAGLTGAGKTSLARAIAGLDPTNGGTVILDGAEMAAGQRRGWWTSVDASKGSFWNRIFSGGASVDRTKQVEDLIRRLENATGVIILDDPFKPTDANSHYKLRDAIERRRDAGLVIIVTSADFEDLAALCDRVLVLAGTEVEQIGTPPDVYEKPGSVAVAIATGRCNLFSGRRLTSSKADLPEFQTIEGEHRIFAQSIERGALGAINQTVALGIRPEHISISFGASFPEDNLLRATITGVRFLGPATLIELNCGGLPLEALVLRLVGLSIGDECVVGLPPERVHIFK